MIKRPKLNKELCSKVNRRLSLEIIKYFRGKSIYPMLYMSWWYSYFFSKNRSDESIQYIAARPNIGAGIGHQIANWIAGYWFAKFFGLRFAHIPFASDSWEQFLGFGDQEDTVKELLEKHQYKRVLLPLFDEYNVLEIERIKRIIGSYKGQKVIFILEQDQFYHDQFGVMDEIKTKFYAAKSRKEDRLIFNPENYNIVIHVRRGDIVQNIKDNNSNLAIRWQNNSYFEKVLGDVVNSIEPKKPIMIYFFSQGQRLDFSEFEKFKNLQFCLDMNAQESFLHMVYADLLITSKSSFSYKPALLSRGLKICPKQFWHGYPDKRDWILVEENGDFNMGGNNGKSNL